MKTYIYNEEPKHIITLNYEVEKFKSNPKLYYPSWSASYHATDTMYYFPILDNGIIREMTRVEKVQAGLETLISGEKIVDGEITFTPAPAHFLKPHWVNGVWIETATQEEIDEHNFNIAVEFYNSELVFASKATAELACEIISPEMYEDVKVYMKAIDPYAQAVPQSLERPPVFDRYKNK